MDLPSVTEVSLGELKNGYTSKPRDWSFQSLNFPLGNQATHYSRSSLFCFLIRLAPSLVHTVLQHLTQVGLQLRLLLSITVRWSRILGPFSLHKVCRRVFRVAFALLQFLWARFSWKCGCPEEFCLGWCCWWYQATVEPFSIDTIKIRSKKLEGWLSS